MIFEKQELQLARQQYRWQVSLCKSQNKKDANGDLVEVRMTFEEWFQIWIDSGNYHLRGTKRGCYCMARKNDLGHYEIGNVEIITHADNVKFAQTGVRHHLFGKTGVGTPMFGKTGSKSHMFGKTGKACHNTKGVVVATNISTKTKIYMDGKRAIESAGFNQAAVYRCISGIYSKNNIHLGHKFHRITHAEYQQILTSEKEL